jgi:hypothetical protein
MRDDTASSDLHLTGVCSLLNGGGDEYGGGEVYVGIRASVSFIGGVPETPDTCVPESTPCASASVTCLHRASVRVVTSLVTNVVTERSTKKKARRVGCKLPRVSS